jgi:hypothetical protein
MAVVIRYFSTAAAGSGDGTTWANRAALFSSGNWSSVITGFDFSGSDSLECRIGPGSYSCTQSLDGASFANAPSAANRLFLVGADSSGNALAVTAWSPDEEDLPTTGMPDISSTVMWVNLSNCHMRSIKLACSANDSAVRLVTNIERCHITSTGTGGNFIVHRCPNVIESSVYANSNSYHGVIGTDSNRPFMAKGCRVRGSAGTTNDRRGITVNAFGPSVSITECVVFGVGGVGVRVQGNATPDLIANNVVVNAGSHGIEISRSSTSNDIHAIVANNVVVNSGGWGINQSSSVGLYATNNRLRDNTSGNITGLGNYAEFDNYTTDADDAADFVDATNGNYQIKSTAGFAGRNIGVSQQAAASGGGIFNPFKALVE